MTTVALPAQMTNSELVLWTFEQLNTRSVAVLRQVWNDATYQRFPDAECHGAGDLIEYFNGLFAALPDFRIRMVAMAAEGDDVFAQWKVTGTHTGGPWRGIEPTGRRVEIDGMDHFVLRDGMLISNFVVFDQLQFARALGLLPPDASPADRAMKKAFNAKTRLRERLSRRGRTPAR